MPKDYLLFTSSDIIIQQQHHRSKIEIKGVCVVTTQASICELGTYVNPLKLS